MFSRPTIGVFQPSAKAQEVTAVVIDSAPIYLFADANRTPLRVAAPGTILLVKAEEGQWIKVEFKDPQHGLRTGYVEARLVRIRQSELQPMDLSVSSQPSRSDPTDNTPARQPSPGGPASPSGKGSTPAPAPKENDDFTRTAGAARKVDQYAAQKVIHSKGGSFYVLLI